MKYNESLVIDEGNHNVINELSKYLEVDIDNISVYYVFNRVKEDVLKIISNNNANWKTYYELLLDNIEVYDKWDNYYISPISDCLSYDEKKELALMDLNKCWYNDIFDLHFWLSEDFLVHWDLLNFWSFRWLYYHLTWKKVNYFNDSHISLIAGLLWWDTYVEKITKILDENFVTNKIMCFENFKDFIFIKRWTNIIRWKDLFNLLNIKSSNYAKKHLKILFKRLGNEELMLKFKSIKELDNDDLIKLILITLNNTWCCTNNIDLIIYLETYSNKSNYQIIKKCCRLLLKKQCTLDGFSLEDINELSGYLWLDILNIWSYFSLNNISDLDSIKSLWKVEFYVNSWITWSKNNLTWLDIINLALWQKKNDVVYWDVLKTFELFWKQNNLPRDIFA